MTIKLTRLDLDYILTQIQMAEAGQVPVNPLLSFGLREVAGTNNNLVGGPEHLRLVAAAVPDAHRSDVPECAGRHLLFADQRPGHRRAPRTISVLVASQNANQRRRGRHSRHRRRHRERQRRRVRRAADALSYLGDGYLNYTLPGADGIYGTADDTGTTFARPRRRSRHRRRHHRRSATRRRRPMPPAAARPPGPGAEPVHPQHHAGRRPVGAVQQLLHLLRPVLRPRPRPDHQAAAAARCSSRCRRMIRCTCRGSPDTNFMVLTRARTCPAPTACSARRTTSTQNTTRRRRSSTRTRPTPRIPRIRCSCAST